MTPEFEGVIRLGIPDGYGTYYLPRILSSFSKTYPRIQLEVRSEYTAQLIEALNEGDLDLALTARDPAIPGGEMLWEEPIVWVGTKETPIHEEGPLPLLLFSQGCVIRARALQALDDCDLRWRMVYCSPSLAAVQAAVQAGLGIAVLGSSTVLPGMRILGKPEGLPALPPSIIELHCSEIHSSLAIDKLARHIRVKLKGWLVSPNSMLSHSDYKDSELLQVG